VDKHLNTLRHSNRFVRGAAFVAATLLVTACSSGMEGVYSDKSGMFSYKFKSGGKVELTSKVLGVEQTAEMDYKLEDGKVKLGMAGGPMQVISIDKNGCLEAGFMGKMCRKKT